MAKYKISDLVGVTEGPMQKILGVVVRVDDEKKRYLVRFTGLQQLYYAEEQMYPWNHGDQ